MLRIGMGIVPTTTRVKNMNAILIAALMATSFTTPQFDKADSNNVGLQAYCEESLEGDLGLASATDIHGNVYEFESCYQAHMLGIIGPY